MQLNFSKYWSLHFRLPGKILMVIFLCASFVIISTISSFSQTFFNVYDADGTASGGQAMKIDLNDDIILAGNRGDSALVMKVDDSGNAIWSTTFQTNAPDLVNVLHLEIDLDNNIIGVGNSYGSQIDNMFYFKMNSNGELIWLHQETEPYQIIGYRIFPVDANFYTLSFTTYDLNSFEYPDITMATVDASTGNIISLTPRYNFNADIPYIDESMAATLASDGNIYATGRNYMNGGLEGSMRSFVTKHTSEGTYVQGKYLCWSAEATARIYATDIIESDGGLSQVYIGDNNGVSTDFEIGIMHTDMEGNVIWSKNYDIVGSTSDVASKIMRTSYGYALAGYANAPQTNMFILAVDEDGDVLWCKSYDQDSQVQDYLNTYGLMAENVNDRIFLTGRSGTPGDQHCFLMAVDENGFLSADCIESNDLNVNQSNNPEAEFDFVHSENPNTLDLDALTPIFNSTLLTSNCPEVDIALEIEITGCDEIEISATTNPPGNYTWNDGSTGNTLVVNSPGVYWVSATVDCCTYVDSIDISFDSISTESFNFSFDILQIDTCSLSIDYAITSNLDSVLVEFGDGTSSASFYGSHTFPGPGAYWIYSTGWNDCTFLEDSILVSFDQSLPVSSFTYAGLPCTDSPIDFTNLSDSGSDFTWLFGDGNSSSQFEPSHVYATPGNYTVELIASDGCSSDTSEFALTIVDIPTITLEPTFTICAGDSVVLEAMGSGNLPLIYNWSDSAETDNILVVSPETTSVYTVTITDASGCQISASAEVNVLPIPELISSGDTIVCEGESVEISAYSNLEDNLVWSNSFIGNQQVVSPGSTTLYSVQVNNPCGTFLSDSVLVEVIEYPVIDFVVLANGNALSPGDAIELYDLPVTIQYFSTSSGDSCTWLLNNQPVTNLESIITAPGNYEYTLWCVNNSICSANNSVSIAVTRPFAFYIPNAITLDFDGINDVFYGIGENYLTQKMMVFNRWGEKIFESTAKNPIWNGSYGETLVQDGIYPYIIEVKDISNIVHVFKGHVTVVR